MKILNVTAQKPHSTGSGTYLTELVKSFDALGHKQSVVAGIYREDSVNFPSGTAFYPVYFDESFPIVGMSDIMPYDAARYRDMTPEMLREFEDRFVQVLKKAISEFNPDLILCHHLFLLTSIVRKHFPDKKVYGICHGTCLRQINNSDDTWAIDIEEIKSSISKLDRIFALHEPQAKEIAQVFNTDKISVIGSGYNPTLFNTDGRIDRKTSEPVRIIYAGKISSPKGIPELIKALEMLDCENYEMTFVGGCQEQWLSEELSRMQEETDCVKVFAPVNQGELAELYKQNDILVLPSYFEGLSLVPIEAMACGLIPICTDLPGMKVWIDANVRESNVRYLPMPEMASIDSPTEAGRANHIEAICEALRTAIADVSSGKCEPKPDTSKITWMEVAKKVLV